MDYNRAFDRIVRSALWDLPEVERQAAIRSSVRRRGDLSSYDSVGALVDTFRFQRSHADAFIEALRISSVAFPDAPLAVVDIGAGACTVAVAMSEHWGASVANVRYHAVEPHLTMCRLGRELLSEGGWEGQLVQQVGSLDDLSNHGESRLLVTLSYLVHQSAVTNEDVSAWAGFIAGEARVMGMEVEVLITTANSDAEELQYRDRTNLFLHKLAEYGVHVTEFLNHCLRVDPRDPQYDRLVGPDGIVTWCPKRGDYPNVRVRYWRVSSDRRDPPSSSW